MLSSPFGIENLLMGGTVCQSFGCLRMNVSQRRWRKIMSSCFFYDTALATLDLEIFTFCMTNLYPCEVPEALDIDDQVRNPTVMLQMHMKM